MMVGRRLWWVLAAVLVAVGLAVGIAQVDAAYSTINPQSSIVNRQSSIPNRQSPIANRQSPITVTLTADPPQLTVGDLVTLTVTAVHPSGSRILWPTWGETWGDLEIRGQQPPQTVTAADGTHTTTQTVLVTLWSPGVYTTPPLTVTAAAANGELMEVTAVPISLTVHSVLTEDDLTLRDIKPQASLQPPSRWPWLLAGLLGAVVLAAAGYGAWRHWPQRTRAAAVPLPAIDNRPAHEIALAELARIAALKLPAQVRFKEHYTLVSDALRRYLENGLALPALDRTTAEIRRDLRHTPVAPEAQAQLLSLLNEADLVKFAKVTPDLLSAQQLPTQAQQLILSIASRQSSIVNGGGE